MPNVRIAPPFYISSPEKKCPALGFCTVTDNQDSPEVQPRKKLTPAAERALAEAEARRAAAQENILKGPREINGPKGPEPTRYGDWENKGIASDF